VTSPRKKLEKRAPQDRSQTLRRSFQLAFLLLNLWIGIQFYLFVRYYETGGRSLWVDRPAGVEGWLPIASLMNLKALVFTGELPRIVAGLISVGDATIFGAAGAALVKFLGGLSETVLVSTLVAWAVGPIAMASRVLRGRDL
jgi:polyferredoxin